MTEGRSNSMERRLARAARFLDYRRLSQRTQVVVTVVAGLFFAVGAVVSWNRLDIPVSDLRWWPVLALLATAPLPLLVSALEFKATAHALGDDVETATALEIAVLGFAANFLPIPGGTLLRISTLSSAQDSSVGRSTHVTVTVGGIWLGIAALVAGIGVLALGSGWFGLILAGAGVVALIVTVESARRLGPLPSLGGFLARITTIEVGFVALAALRTYLAFLVLDLEVPVLAVVVVSAASALSTAVGIAPSGLGLREAIAAVLAGAAGLSPSSGFLASALLRLTGSIAAGLLAGVPAVQRRLAKPREGPSREGP